MSVFGPGVSQFAGLLANVTAALLSALFVLRFRRPITHLIRNQPRERRAPRHGLQLLRLIGPLWFVPFLLLVGISLVSTVAAADDSGRSCAGPAVRAGGDRGHGRRRRHPPRL